MKVTHPDSPATVELTGQEVKGIIAALKFALSSKPWERESSTVADTGHGQVLKQFVKALDDGQS